MDQTVLFLASGGLRGGDVAPMLLPWVALLCLPSFLLPSSTIVMRTGPLQRTTGLALALMRVPGGTEEWPVMLAVLAFALAPLLRTKPLPPLARGLTLGLGVACTVASSVPLPQPLSLGSALLTLDLTAAYVATPPIAALLALPLVMALGARGGVRGVEWGTAPMLGLAAATWLRPVRARLWVAIAGVALALCARTDPNLEFGLLLTHALARWAITIILALRSLFKQAWARAHRKRQQVLQKLQQRRSTTTTTKPASSSLSSARLFLSAASQQQQQHQPHASCNAA